MLQTSPEVAGKPLKRRKERPVRNASRPSVLPPVLARVIPHLDQAKSYCFTRQEQQFDELSRTNRMNFAQSIMDGPLILSWVISEVHKLNHFSTCSKECFDAALPPLTMSELFV